MRFSRHLVALLFTVFCGALLTAPPRTHAITYGFIDTNNTYSNVGAFIVKSPSTGKHLSDLFGDSDRSNVFPDR